MKKLLLVSLLLLATNVNAQKWEKKIIEADELKGQTEAVMYEWTNTDCSFIIYEGNNSWILSGAAFKPDPTHVNHRNNFETFAKVGFYNYDDMLIESWDNCRLELTNFYRTATSGTSRKKKGQYAVSDYLKNGSGYIRIIIPTIQGDDFDVTVPCIME